MNKLPRLQHDAEAFRQYRIIRLARTPAERQRQAWYERSYDYGWMELLPTVVGSILGTEETDYSDPLKVSERLHEDMQVDTYIEGYSLTFQRNPIERVFNLKAMLTLPRANRKYRTTYEHEIGDLTSWEEPAARKELSQLVLDVFHHRNRSVGKAGTGLPTQSSRSELEHLKPLVDREEGLGTFLAQLDCLFQASHFTISLRRSVISLRVHDASGTFIQVYGRQAHWQFD